MHIVCADLIVSEIVEQHVMDESGDAVIVLQQLNDSAEQEQQQQQHVQESRYTLSHATLLFMLANHSVCPFSVILACPACLWFTCTLLCLSLPNANSLYSTTNLLYTLPLSNVVSVDISVCQKTHVRWL